MSLALLTGAICFPCSCLLRLLSIAHALANHFTGPQIFIGGHLKQHRLECVVVDLPLRGQHGFLRVGRRNLTDETLKALCLIDVLHGAAHGDRGSVDDGRPRFPNLVGEQFGFIHHVPADATGVVSLGQQGLVHNVDGEGAAGLDPLVGVVGLGEADHHPVMADDTDMAHQEPVGFPLHHRAHHQRRGVEGQGISDLLFHRDTSKNSVCGDVVFFQPCGHVTGKAGTAGVGDGQPLAQHSVRHQLCDCRQALSKPSAAMTAKWDNYFAGKVVFL